MTDYKAYPLRGDRKKAPDTILLRHITLDEIPHLLGGEWPKLREAWTIDRNGCAARIRTNGRLKTWKKDPTRFEQSWKYGLYEYFRLDAQQMLNNVFLSE